jgi:hypothetical protein
MRSVENRRTTTFEEQETEEGDILIPREGMAT